MKNYKSVDELPRISEPVAYQLIHRADFPAVKVGDRRYIVPKDRLLQWMGHTE